MSLRALSLLVRRNLLRRPVRTLVTMLGVALAVALLVGIESFSSGLDRALESGDRARTLIVYRENRYCPQTSFLPERYAEEIASVPGVDSVLPVKVFLNNCRTNLDMITFHGAPVDVLLEARDVDLIEGDLEQFRREPDAALVGRAFALRRGLSVGDAFRFGDILVKVAGVFRSSDPTQEGVILTHLEFLQRASPVKRLGTVTQLEVRIAKAADGEGIAREIDRRFTTAEEPTDTRPATAFLERATRDLREILRFARLFGAACVLVVLLLVSSTVLLAVHERRRELGVFRTIGYPGTTLAGWVLAETAVLVAGGSLAGATAMALVITASGFAIGVEGIQVSFALTPSVIFQTIAIASGCTLLASILPAIRAARGDIIAAVRSGN